MLDAALLDWIEQRGSVTREEMLEFVFEAMEAAVARLTSAGVIEVSHAPGRQCHLDMFEACTRAAPLQLVSSRHD